MPPVIKYLVESAQRMKRVFEGFDFYRIGGDEFVIICPGVAQDDFANRVIELKSILMTDKICRAAIGSPMDGGVPKKDIQQIVANADEQMYEDKKAYYRTHSRLPGATAAAAMKFYHLPIRMSCGRSL